MDIDTGREFSFHNPQDDHQDYPVLPPGFRYDLYGHIIRDIYQSRTSYDKDKNPGDKRFGYGP
jgi:hypothetical protein